MVGQMLDVLKQHVLADQIVTTNTWNACGEIIFGKLAALRLRLSHRGLLKTSLAQWHPCCRSALPDKPAWVPLSEAIPCYRLPDSTWKYSLD